MQKSLSVLFVSDSDIYTEKIVKKLHDSGCEVSFSRVENGSQLRTALDDARWEIIVSDFFLPTLDAGSLFDILHEREMKIPCIAVSDQTDPEKLIAAMKSGISDYILDANLDRLIPAVEHALADTQDISSMTKGYEGILRVAKRWESIFPTFDMIWICDLNLKMLWYNKALAEFISKPSAMITDRKCSQVFHGLDEPSLECPYKEVLASRKPVTTILFDSLWKRHFQLTVSPILDDAGVMTATVHIVRDITEKVKIQEELKTTESLYHSITHNSHSGVVIVQNKKIVYANPYVISDYGYTEEILFEKDMLDFVYPEDREKAKINVVNMLKRQSSTPYTYRIVCADGQIRWVVETVSSITYKGKRAVLGNIMDITDRIQTEQQLKEVRDMLIQAEKLSAIGTLAGGISHEILNPLNIISMTIQMMGLKEWPSEKTKEMLAVCERQVQRIERIARDINLYAKTSKNEVAPASLNVLTESVLNLIGPKMRLAHIVVNKQFQPDMPDILMDQNNMWQVIMNLASNAIDAMAEKEHKVLTVVTDMRTSPEGDIQRIVFNDTGTGISADALNKVFDPFFTTKEPGKGTGLGLSITAGIIRDHGGRISAENNKEGGASFIVELPVAQK